MHTAVIDWGDGTTSEAIITESDGSGSISGSYKYVTGGIYDVKVSLSDDDNGTATQATKAMITGAGIHNRVLQIVGTEGKDHVEVEAKGKNHEWIEVESNFLSDKGHTRTFRADDFDSIVIIVGDGNDHVTVDKKIVKPVLIDGGAGNDHLMAGGGATTLLGGEGNDKLIGSRADDWIFGGNGNDVIFGGSGNDFLDGGNGNDVIFGSCGDDTILGGDGNDWIFGGPGNDVLDGGNGNDRLFGGRGNDILSGGNGNDVLQGGAGNDTLVGGNGHHALSGGPGDDVLIGFCSRNRYYQGFTMSGDGDTTIGSAASWVCEFVSNLAGNGEGNPNNGIQVILNSGADA